jgi:hypothetical protein
MSFGPFGWPGQAPTVPNATYVPAPASTFVAPFGSFGPESGIGPNGSTGPTYGILYGPSWLCLADHIITGLRVVVTAALSSNTLRIGLVSMGSDDQPTQRVLDAGTVDASSTGNKDITGLDTRLTAGNWYASYVIRYGGGGSVSIRSWPVPYGHFGQDTVTTNRVYQTRGTTFATASDAELPFRPPRWDASTAGAANNLAGPQEFLLVQRKAVQS